MRESNVPATPNVARPAASATKKYLGEIFFNQAAKYIAIAPRIDATKNVRS